MESPPSPPPSNPSSTFNSYLLIIVACGIVTLIVIALLASSGGCWRPFSLRRSLSCLCCLWSSRAVEGPKTPETLIPVCRFREDESTFSTECSVCLSAFRKGEKVRQLPACKHSFHAPCIDMWLRSQTSCPCCRAPVPQIAAAIEGERLQRGEEEEAAAAAAEAVVVEEEEENREVIVSVESA